MVNDAPKPIARAENEFQAREYRNCIACGRRHGGVTEQLKCLEMALAASRNMIIVLQDDNSKLLQRIADQTIHGRTAHLLPATKGGIVEERRNANKKARFGGE